MGDLLESRKRDSHDGNAGIQGPDPGEGDLAGDDAGKERGQNYRVREKRAVCRKCHADGHGHARDGRKAGKRNEACERIQGKEKLTSSPPQAARIPTASRFVFPRWLRWVPPTTALLGPRRGFTFGLPVYRSFGQRSSEGKERGALYPRPKNAEALRRTW